MQGVAGRGGSQRQRRVFGAYVSQVAQHRFAVSLPTTPDWRQSEITHSPMGGGLAITVPHLPVPPFPTLNAAIAGLMPILSEAANFADATPASLFGYKHLSDHILANDSVKKHMSEANKGNAGAKKAVFTLVGGAIAELNQYQYAHELSELNRTPRRLRRIYKNEALKMHLSIDFEKGAFEVLNRYGKHVKEINFRGEQTKPSDPSGGHDIKLK